MILARENPLRIECVRKFRYRFSEAEWSNLLSALAQSRYRAAIVGPQGSGKTTLLEDLQLRLNQLHCTKLIRFSEGERSFPIGAHLAVSEMTNDQILLVDGAEQLSRISWWKLRFYSRQWKGLIVTSHFDGLLPTLYRTASDSRVLFEMLDELVPEYASYLKQYIPDLFQRYHGNLREVLLSLYDKLTALNAVSQS